MLTLERDDIDPRQPRGPVLVFQAPLGRRGNQRAFRGIAVNFPPLRLFGQRGVVAQQTRQQALPRGAVVGQGGVWLAQGLDLAEWSVAAAGDLIQRVTRQDFAHGHLVDRERAGFVRTDDGGAPQSLDGGQPADDGSLAGHPRDTDRQGDRDRRRQSFRDRSHRQRHRRHEHLGRRSAAQPAHQKRDGRQAQNHDQQQTAELRDLACQRRLQHVGGGNQLRDEPHLGLRARCEDHSPRLTVGHEGGREGQIATLREQSVGRDNVHVFVHRDGFAGQSRFIDLQVAAVKQTQVGGHLVAGLQQDDVAGHQLGGGDSPHLTGPQDTGFRQCRLSQRRQRLRRAGLLQKSDEGVDEDDAKDHAGIHPFFQDRRDRRRRQQDVHQRRVELQQEPHPRTVSPRGGNHVGTELGLPRAKLQDVQPLFGVCAQQPQHVLGGKPVQILSHGYVHSVISFSIRSGTCPTSRS